MRGTGSGWSGWSLLLCLLLVAIGCEEPRASYRTPLVPVSGGAYASVAGLVDQPNIILINLDDADRDSLELDLENPDLAQRFPHLTRLAREGVRFTNYHAAVPICGPSRACLLTGQYAYKNGIRCNQPNSRFCRGVTGGYLPYRNSGAFGATNGLPYRDNDLGVWMQEAGYHTMLVGKYLHDDFQPQAGEDWNSVYPSGWDDFYPTLGGRYFNFYCSQNGEVLAADRLDKRVYPVKYRTVKESIDAQRLIAQHLREDSRPFFLYLAPFAPHIEEPSERCITEDQPDRGMVEPKYRGTWPELEPAITPDYDEADMTDKPATVQQLPRLDRSGTDYATDDRLRIRMEYRRRLLSLRSVDEMLEQLFRVIDEGGATGNTMILLTSDHGFQLGHQRHVGKGMPYDRATNSPLFCWAPGYINPHSEPLPHLLSQVDLAPTLLEIAGAPLPEGLQGKSFLPLLDGRFGGEPPAWRPDGILIEHWEQINDNGVIMDTTFQSLRLHDSIYTEWATGDREYYNLADDPWQLQNGFVALPEERVDGLRAQLRGLKAEMPKPVCFIEKPLNQNHVFLRKAELRGLAEYREGIAEVRLMLSDITEAGKTRFWNGTEWSAERVLLPARLATTENLVTEWRYEFAPPLEQERRYRLVARAVGNGGVVAQETAMVDFAIDHAQPLTIIETPLPDRKSKRGNGIEIRGESFDREGINSVRIVIADRPRKLFWNGTAWQTERVSLKATINQWYPERATWTYLFVPPEERGNAQVLVTAINGKTVADQPPRVQQISWDY